MRLIRKVTISLYRKTGSDDFPKIVEDISLGPSPNKILKAKATRLLQKHARCRLEPWQLSEEYYPEYYRNAGDFQVRIHKFE